MPKRTSKKTSPTQWTDRLDPEAVEAACEDATVDAHDEDEQYSGFLSVLEDELVFPFSAKIFDDVVTVVDFEASDDAGFCIDLIFDRDGKRQRIAAWSAELIEPFPEGHLTLAAYLKWRRFV